MRDFNADHISEIAPADQWAEKLYGMLKAKGSPDICYVISTNSQLDREELSLIDVLDEIVGVGHDGTFVSCLPGRLGYYEGESMGDRIILEKT